jgi:uncharacterized protein (DUF2147 family)
MRQIWIPVLFLLSLAAAQGESGVLGKWTNPSGSTIQIYPCGKNTACARLIAISSTAPTHHDESNPNPAMRSRSLCGLQIGTSFHLVDADHAEDGQLYDPKSGKTYSGSMTSEGDKLRLRGYVGIPLFGRTETWTRARVDVAPCHS